jgi:hypothetical protein
MANASPQFSPAQLLDSGRRAETEGKLDLAAQFYRHLADHHAYTAEAAEAHNGLGRVGATQSQIWQPVGNGAHHNGNGYANGHGGVHVNGGTHAPIGQPVPGGAFVNGGVHLHSGTYANGTAQAMDIGHRAPRRFTRRRPVAPRDHYRAGRFLARAFSGLGWLIVVAGVLAASLYFLPGSPMLHFGILPVLGSSVAAVVVGFSVVFSGQIARAVFDQANATRDLVALERAKYGD